MAPSAARPSGRYDRAGLLDDATPREPDFAADDHGMSLPAHLPASERSVAALGAEPGRVDRPGYVGVDQRDVGISTGSQGSLVRQAQQVRRVAGELGESL